MTNYRDLKNQVSWFLSTVCNIHNVHPPALRMVVHVWKLKYTSLSKTTNQTGNFCVVHARKSVWASRRHLISLVFALSETTVLDNTDKWSVVQRPEACDTPALLEKLYVEFWRSLCGPYLRFERPSRHKCACCPPTTQFMRQISWGYFMGERKFTSDFL